MTQTWSLPATPHAAGMARSYVGDACRRCRPEVGDTARLLVSEVVTNAVQHGHGPVTLRATLTNEDLLVEVGDQHTTMPTPAVAKTCDEHGRGLAIVEALSNEWGAHPVGGSGEQGKTVWFRVRR